MTRGGNVRFTSWEVKKIICFNSKTLAAVTSVRTDLEKIKPGGTVSWFCFTGSQYGDVLLLFIFFDKINNPVDFHSKSVSLSLKIRYLNLIFKCLNKAHVECILYIFINK